MSASFVSTLIQFVIVFALLLFFHEFGHFIIARLLHIEVEEFGFGFPPRIVRLFHAWGTDFTLNWIPFGAFVRIKGENDPNVKGGMASAGPWTRLGILLGGPVTNILVGIVIFTAVFMRIGAPQTNIVQVMDVAANSPAQVAGLKAGDIILKVNGTPITSITGLQDAIQANLGQPIELSLRRGNQTLQLEVTPRANPPKNQGPLGISISNPYMPITLPQALPTAVSTAYEQMRQIILLPVHLIQGSLSADQARVVGPVGMFDIYQEARQRDIQASEAPTPELPAVNVMWFVGTISIALGLTNLFPIPALDGGRILFVLPELLLRRKVPAQYENLVHLIGFATLILFISYVTFQDLVHPVVLP